MATANTFGALGVGEWRVCIAGHKPLPETAKRYGFCEPFISWSLPSQQEILKPRSGGFFLLLFSTALSRAHQHPFRMLVDVVQSDRLLAA